MKYLLRYIFFLLLLISASELFSQSFIKEASIDTACKLARIDQFGNIYAVTPANELLKYNAKGQKLWAYSNKNFGDINQIDVKDPLRVVVYYPNHQQIIVLNNNLSEIGRYSFNRDPDIQITLVASANNNGYWIYDQLNRELRKLSNTFTDELKTGNIYQRDGIDMQATYLYANDSYVFVNDRGEGIRIFDRFGNFYKTAVVDAPQDFEVEGSKIFFKKDGKLCIYDFLSFQLVSLQTPSVKNPINFIKYLNHLLIIGEKELTLWSLKND
ncbi:hypothetical protein [Pseudopedobacter sp.]|uniref:hypothetical protein n=1 Tax=Pseudopedobacter sp. TaxID=1936787 RepID=UPI00333F75FA